MTALQPPDTDGGQVLVVGSINHDLVVRVQRLPSPGETLTAYDLVAYAGGKGANQAAAAARAGASVELVGAVGQDAAGDLLLAALQAQGVGTDGVRRVATATGSAVIMVSDSGENTIAVVAGANHGLGPGHLDPWLSDMRPGDVVLTQLESSIETVAAVAARTTTARLLVNASPLDDNDSTVAELWDVALCHADPLVVNEIEAKRLLAVLGDPGDREVAAMPGALAAYGPASVVVTAGASGAWWHGQGTDVHVEAQPVEVVVDTTGAGDAFTGALAAALAAGADPGTALARAVRAGAAAVTWRGAQPVDLSRPEARAD